MSFDQRPARATKRISTPQSEPRELTPQAPVPTPAEEAEPKSIAMTLLFIGAALIGGLATTAFFYGLIPGTSAVTLPPITLF